MSLVAYVAHWNQSLGLSHGTAHATTVLARPPAAAPAGGCVACRVPAPGLPPSSPMPRGPPPRTPPLFPEYVVTDGNRLGADSCAPVGPTAASGPGFHVRWQPSGPRVSARAIPVSAGWRGPPADARFPPLSMNSELSPTMAGLKADSGSLIPWWFRRRSGQKAHLFFSARLYLRS